MPRTANSGFDVAAVDRENHAVVLVEVKVTPPEGWMNVLPDQLSRYGGQVDSVLTIDPINIQLYRWEKNAITGPIVRLDTARVLQHYDQDFPKRRVFEAYMLTLVEAWLRDLAYHWKSANPPGSEELRRAGLLEKLEGGTTQLLGA